MSENKPVVGILEQMKKQHQMYCVQRDQAQVNFQQLVGAIFALESMIKFHEEELKKQLSDRVNAAQGVSNNGEINDKEKKQAA